MQLTERYFPLVQKPHCCNATCLQMILLRRGYRFMQDHIAQIFKPKIDEWQKDTFIVPIKFSKKDFNTLGSVSKFNLFFRKYNLPLMAESYKISKIENVEKFLMKNLELDNDLIAEVANEPLFKMKGGHDILIESINESTVIVVDPSPNHKQRYSITLRNLIEAMDKKWGRESGFVVIKRI